MKRAGFTLIIVFILICSFLWAADANDAAKKIDVLILPKFEIGELFGDFPGEAQYYYEEYLDGSDVYEISGGYADSKLYLKDGIGLYITGMGKINAALSLHAILTDDRFDLSDTYVFSTGCAGTSYGHTVMGDVVLVTAVVDYDLGHHADPRDLSSDREVTWFRDESFDSDAYKLPDQDLMDRIFGLIKDIKIETTDLTRKWMAAAFNNEDWAVRDPMVIRGTTVTGDNYWKGWYDHQNAVLMAESYDCPDPYTVTEMEEIGIASALDRMGMLDRLIILRSSVNMDVFMNGTTPELLWGFAEETLASDLNLEAVDIFAQAMKNNFEVGRVIIEAIRDGSINGAAPEQQTETGSQNALDLIRKRGVLRVGSAGDYQPMSYLNPETGEYEGFDAELAEDLAASLGVGLEYIGTSWPNLMADTIDRKFDLAVCGITITDARQEQALMSEGYLGNGKTILIREEDKDLYTSLEDINQPWVRVMENPGGLNEKFARENLGNAQLIIHDVNQEIPGLIAEGEADVMITEIMEAGYYVGRDSRLAAPLIYPFTNGQLGVLMPKGSEDLLDYVNRFLEEEKASGRIDELAEQYIYRYIQMENDAQAVP